MHRLGYLILYVSDLPASVAFYRDVVGLDHKFTDAGYAEFATGEARFALYERRRAAWLIGGDPALGPTGEAVFVVDDVDSQAIRLTSLGIDVLSGPVDRPWGHRTLHIADPDGFVVEFAQPIPRSRSRKNEKAGTPSGGSSKAPPPSWLGSPGTPGIPATSASIGESKICPPPTIRCGRPPPPMRET